MKRFQAILLTAMLMSSLCFAQTSLADAARAAREQKKAAPKAQKVFTNDDLSALAAKADQPSSGTLETPAANKPEGEADKDKAKKEGEKSDDAAAKAAADAYKQQYADTQKELATLERELAIVQREQQIKAAEYYADAGARLRNEQQWVADEKKRNDEVAAKQKAIADAKAKLDDIKEQARKAGVKL